jgi:hypothetical protein
MPPTSQLSAVIKQHARSSTFKEDAAFLENREKILRSLPDTMNMGYLPPIIPAISGLIMIKT